MYFVKLIFFFVGTLFALSINARDNETCGITSGKPLTNHYGPFDYTNPADAKTKLTVVVNRHFTKEIERLTAYNARADIDYTLRAFPNHHRALIAMDKLQHRWKQQGTNHNDVYSAECYYKRALYFAPHDVTSWYIYAISLHRAGKNQDAKEIYVKVLEKRPQNVEAHYNYGLLLVDMEDYLTAKKHAEIAYKGNYPLIGLKEKLKASGNW